MSQAGFRKGRWTRDQIANIYWIIKKVREFQKNIYFCFIDYAKAFDCVDPTNAGNLVFGSSAFSKFSLYIWKFSVHILLKPSLKDFEHYFASMWDE